MLADETPLGYKNRIVLVLKLAVIFVAAALVAGCGRTVADNRGRLLEFETIKKGHMGFAFKETDAPEYRVFKTKRQWQRFWEKASKRSPDAQDSAPGIRPGRPFVDPDWWSQQMSPLGDMDVRATEVVVGVFFDEYQGTDVSIKDIRQFPDKVLVRVERRVDDPGGAGIISPYQIVKFQNVGLPVTFRLIDKKTPQ